MYQTKADLSNCDREQIHLLGQIQSHGFLLVIDKYNIIQYYSDNISNFITGIGTGLIGKPLKYVEDIINVVGQEDVLSHLVNFGRANKNFEQTNPVLVDIFGVSFYLIISNSGSQILMEFEPVNSDLKADVQKLLGKSITQMLADKKKLQSLLENAAVQVKDIIKYDRIMIYRFGEDGHGEIVAEAKNDNLESWLGLHYPASDIPKQARDLYKINLTRIIADVNTVPAKIMSTKDINYPLDLSLSQLRAVSPIHIQYLKNMGVVSSFSISLINNDELWGLIACHNYTPRFIDYKAREAAKLIGQILSSALAYRQDEENIYLQNTFKLNQEYLTKCLQKSTNIDQALTSEQITILDIVHASGAVVLFEKNFVRLGITPDDDDLNGLIDWLQIIDKEEVYYTNNLSAFYPKALGFKEIASGIMVFELSKELREYIIWFKPEKIQTIKWGGNPAKVEEKMEDGTIQISPRHSFEAWSQQVAAKSDKWGIEEISSVNNLKDEILHAINLKAGAIRLLNDKLKEAYEELDTFSFTISHDLKNPITAIKSYAQLLAMDESMGEQGKKVVNRIEERIDKMNTMINAVLEYSRIGRLPIVFKNINAEILISEIIADLEIEKNKYHCNITIGALPNMTGDPIMIAQIFNNLLNNAIKYSQFSPEPQITIEGKIDEDQIIYSIRDNGVGIAPENFEEIFGLFNRMENAKNVEGTGVGLAIVKRIIEKHGGKIWAESELGKGSVFYISFNAEHKMVH